MFRVWDKEKILTGVPDRSQTHDLPKHQVGALSTALQQLMESKVI